MIDSISEYIVSHGASGAVGRFSAPGGLTCRRGGRVVVESDRGLELGQVLCSAGDEHKRLLPPSGRVVRLAGAEDAAAARRLRARAGLLFESARRAAASLGLPVEILDVELLLDGRRAVVQHLRWAECDYEQLAALLAHEYGAEVWMEDLALPAPAEEHGGCGKPGCGKESGGCSTCGTGGGCGTCARGSGVDLRDYFAHLRGKMEEQRRVPLL